MHSDIDERAEGGDVSYHAFLECGSDEFPPEITAWLFQLLHDVGYR